MSMIEYTIILCIVGILATVGYEMYNQSTATKITLNASEWNCSSAKAVEITRNVLVGKLILPQTKVESVCFEYKRVN